MRKNSSYRTWLFQILGEASVVYADALDVMFAIEFYEIIPNDINRVVDGLELRDEYRSEFNLEPKTILDNCSVLEMMVALARRMNNIGYDYTNPDKTAIWFWMMFSNMGLDVYTGRLTTVERRNVGCIIDNMVEREYTSNGADGLFPMYPAPFDSRKTELWYQMQSWIASYV